MLSKIIWDWFHILVYRDMMGPLGKRKYGKCDHSVHIFKPYLSDKNKKNVQIGAFSSIGKYSRIQCYPDATGNIGKLTIGDHCILMNNVTILCGADITIGNNALIASYVTITSENHSIDPESDTQYASQPLTCKKVKIMDGSWIGERVCILPGVVIGKKAVVGAGSIVTKSVPDYCIAAGNPAKIIKKYDFNKHKWESAT